MFKRNVLIVYKSYEWYKKVFDYIIRVYYPMIESWIPKVIRLKDGSAFIFVDLSDGEDYFCGCRCDRFIVEEGISKEYIDEVLMPMWTPYLRKSGVSLEELEERISL